MNETMTPEQFVEVLARHQNATPGPWHYDPTYGEMFLSSSHDGHLHGIGDLTGFGHGDQADADREFVIHSHGDVGALLAEVFRLRTELAEQKQVAPGRPPQETIHADIADRILAVEFEESAPRRKAAARCRRTEAFDPAGYQVGRCLTCGELAPVRTVNGDDGTRLVLTGHPTLAADGGAK